LVLILKKSENEEAKISDYLFWCPNKPVDTGEKRKKIKVQTLNSASDEIVDL
jgi:hypothetical protein